MRRIPGKSSAPRRWEFQECWISAFAQGADPGHGPTGRESPPRWRRWSTSEPPRDDNIITIADPSSSCTSPALPDPPSARFGVTPRAFKAALRAALARGSRRRLMARCATWKRLHRPGDRRDRAPGLGTLHTNTAFPPSTDHRPVPPTAVADPHHAVGILEGGGDADPLTRKWAGPGGGARGAARHSAVSNLTGREDLQSHRRCRPAVARAW